MSNVRYINPGMRHAPALTHDRLRQVLDYDPDTGAFRWRLARKKITVGAVAGRIHRAGYVQVTVDGRVYLAHRLAWFWITGAWPAREIDHKNRDKADNRFCNLRQATSTQNKMNAYRARGRSGHRGVYWSTPKGKWVARIKVDGRSRQLGCFTDLTHAVRVYQSAATEAFGEYAPPVST